VYFTLIVRTLGGRIYPRFGQTGSSDVFIVCNVPPELALESLLLEYPPLFTSRVGTAKCAPYETVLTDTNPVRSPPYRPPPKLEIFREIVDDLLKQGVVRPSKSHYASPAFLVSKSGGGFRVVVDYRKVNSKNVFDSYPMPTNCGQVCVVL
jgi:hypothetical protein